MANPSPTPKITTRKHVARLERERRQVALIRTISVITIVLVSILLVYGAFDTLYLRLRKPVAEVNGEVISLGYWQERMNWQRAQLINTLQLYQYYQQSFGMDTSQQQQQIQFQLQYPEFLGEEVLNALVNEALIRQEAQKLGITVSSDEVEERIQQSGDFNFFPDGTPTPTITPTEFTLPTLTTEQLALYPATSTPTPFMSPTPGPTNTPDPSVTATATPAQAVPTATFLPQPATATSTPYTLDGYKTKYTELIDIIDNFDVSEATYRSVYENEIYREKLLVEVTKDTPHTEEQALVRHILVDDAVTAKAVQALLLNGNDFGKLAREYSKDTTSAVNGGNMEWFGKGQMVSEFEQAAYSQPIGEIGEPVQTQYGYHIIQVIAREELPVSASQYEQLKQTAFNDWLTKLNEEATTAGTIITYSETWQNNIPALPSALLSQ